MVSNKKRIKWLDFAKGFTIFFVVCAHVISSTQKTFGVNYVSLDALKFCIFTFVMPCFFAISGYLYKPTNTWHKYKILIYKKGISIGIPYIIFSIIYVLMQQIGKIMGSNGKNIHVIYPWSSLLKMFAYPISYMWFLFALAFIFIVVGAMDLFHINGWTKILLGLVFLLITPMCPIWPTIADGLENVFCFQIGYLIKLMVSRQYKFIHNVDYSYISLFSWIVLLFIQMHFIGISYATEMMTYQDCITKMLSIFVFFLIFINFKHNLLFRYFDKYGKLTLVIYLVHVPIDSVARILLFKCGFHNVIILLITLIIIVWELSLFICHLCLHFNIIDCVFYPRKYINKLIKETKLGELLFK